MSNKQERIKIASVSERDIANSIVTGDFNGLNKIKIGFDDLPRDAEFLSVYYCFERGAFLFKFRHDSFPEADPGAFLPSIKAIISVVRFDQLVAEKIIGELMTNGNGEKADRLALRQHLEAQEERDLGGYCRKSAIELVASILRSE